MGLYLSSHGRFCYYFFFSSSGFAADPLEQPDTFTRDLQRVNEINKALQGDLPPMQKAQNYYEQAYLLMTLYGLPDSLVVATSSLLKAIELDPKNDAYQQLLSVIYETSWEKLDLSGKDENSVALRELKKKTGKIAKSYARRSGR